MSPAIAWCDHTLRPPSSLAPEHPTGRYRLVRHLPNGGREVLAEGIELPPADVADINRAMVRTMYRLWGVVPEAPAKKERP